MNCESCTSPLQADTAPWYGRFWLCASCKRRSITTGWLPAGATEDELKRLEKEREMLRIVAGSRRDRVH